MKVTRALNTGDLSTASMQLPHRVWQRVNWPLVAGGLIVTLFLVLAWKGPDWAPMNPMQENYAQQANGKFYRPPYPVLTIPGFPLGSDRFGRDILSRLMWGVRPTLIMVLAVAAVRLTLGILIGLSTGWSNGKLGRLLDNLLSAALAVPVLIVALIGIAAIGVDKGLAAFILGLALTGWAETARVVAEQTRAIKNLTYVEASRALGASGPRILLTHVMRQIMPMLWTFVAFEISGTLLVTAELGFLGYFIGGGIWEEVEDFQAVNTTGLPELGQMLATTPVNLTNPTGLLVVGSVLFLAVLGFSLLGEGLRARLDFQAMSARRPLFAFTGKIGDWLDQQVTRPVSGWVEDHAIAVGLTALAIVLLGGWSIYKDSQPTRQPVQAQALISVPGGHLWATERHDAQGTRRIKAAGPAGQKAAWFVTLPGFPGGPVVSSDGTVMVSTLDKMLHAFTPAGKEIWKSPLPGTPVGTPALGPGGDIYVTDDQGGLSAFSRDGRMKWQYLPEGGRQATSGPIVASNGTIYYTRIDRIQAVSPEGKSTWLAAGPSGYLEFPPILSGAESFIFLKDAAFAANSGATVDLQGLPINKDQFTDRAFFVGADGKNYLRSGHDVLGWRSTETGVEVDKPSTWAAQGSVLFFPTETGVTPDGLIWHFYASEYSDTRVVWLELNSKLISNIRFPAQLSRIIGVDSESRLYFCAVGEGDGARCFGIKPGETQAGWMLELQAGGGPVGGALVPGRLYLTTQNGFLYAIGEGQPAGK